jgi:hypothetical protein
MCIVPQVPANHKRLLLGEQRDTVQDYRWVKPIAYEDRQERLPNLNLIVCRETQPHRQKKRSTTTFT